MTEETESHVISWDVNKAAIAEVAEEFKDVNAYEDLEAAKVAKKTLTKMRTALTEAHKETKSEALAFGKLCDTKKNEYMVLIKEIEDPISDDLDAIKGAAAKLEEDRVARHMAEIERIQAFSLDRHSLTLDEMQERLATLRNTNLIEGKLEEFAGDWQLSKDEADLKLRLAIDAEETRLEEKAESDRIAAENQELRDKLAKSEAEQADRDATARAEQDKKDAEARAAQKVIDDERQAELDQQQADIDAEKKRIRDENEAQAEADNKAKADAEAAELAAMQAPDVVKLEKYCEAINQLIGLKPVMGSTAGNAVLLDVTADLIQVETYLKDSIEEMK